MTEILQMAEKLTSPRPWRRRLFRITYLIWVSVALSGCADALEHVPSLYQPALERNLSREERWHLDTELLNEISMKIHNSRRFNVPEPFEKRAQWAESVAHWYRTADLVQQLVDFRRSRMRDNEMAFRGLVLLGQKGDVGAKCLAAAMYRHFSPEITRRWKVSFNQLAHDAVQARSSGHPVCAAVEAGVLVTGDTGYPKDRARAKAPLIESAIADLYGSQMFLSGTHLAGSSRFQPRDVALRLCWQRVADAQSPIASFANTCEAYRLGIAADSLDKDASLPAETQKLAQEWCAPSKTVTAELCARMEQSTNGGEGK